jgi:ADP-dependent NAD(P)H-hydrate dehydratase / NAD(P)H-hydrate epimerase
MRPPGQIITVAQMRAIDAVSPLHGVSTRTMMEAAGRAVARTVLAQPASVAGVDVLCGPGANGGDGYVAARFLREAGRDVRVMALGIRDGPSGDAAHARAAWHGPTIAADPAGLRAGALIVDALFGAGLSRPLDGAAAGLALACQGRAVISVDVPSGVPGDGAPPQGPTFQARESVTFIWPKPAHVLEPSASLCGRVRVVDIGAPAAALAGLAPHAVVNHPSLWRLPAPDSASHKHRRGRVCVLADGPSVSLAHGAQRLAAEAALRAGAGWVCVAVQDAASAGFFASPAALLVQAVGDVALGDFDALVIGPGAVGGPLLAARLAQAAQGRAPLVIDGGALGFAPAHAGSLPAGSVLTPHAGEFARVFPDLAGGDKIARARSAAARSGAVVAFKGADTVIAAPDGRVCVNRHASPCLASAGTGDVLAGLIAGLIAQGMEGFDAACAGAWLHGEAGMRCGAGLTADTLLAGLSGVLQALRPPT